MDKSRNLIWIDLEMTGLDVVNDSIIEIATVVTDSQLNIIAQGPVLAIHQSEEVLANMNAWCQKQHNSTGLVKRVKESTVSEEMAQKMTLEFLKEHTKENTSPMCGNSICQDRRFLAKDMPELEKYFHYRHIDVSTVKELATRLKPELAKYSKKEKHLALDDIIDSIEELKYYKDCFFKL